MLIIMRRNNTMKNTQPFIDRLYNVLKAEYDNVLCPKFGIAPNVVPFMMPTPKEEIQLKYISMWEFTCGNSAAILMRNILDEYLPNGTIMYNYIVGDKNSPLPPLICIIAPQYDIIAHAYEHKDVPEDIMFKYYKLSLKHEFGHVLRAMQLFTTNPKPIAHDMFFKEAADSANLWKAYESSKDFYSLDEKGVREYFEYYYNNIPAERYANELAGITTEEMVQAQLEIMR
jgi:hypothetical protein